MFTKIAQESVSFLLFSCLRNGHFLTTKNCFIWNVYQQQTYLELHQIIILHNTCVSKFCMDFRYIEIGFIQRICHKIGTVDTGFQECHKQPLDHAQQNVLGLSKISAWTLLWIWKVVQADWSQILAWAQWIWALMVNDGKCHTIISCPLNIFPSPGV